MKDLTPIAEWDVALKAREGQRSRAGEVERVGLASEERMRRRRERYERCLPIALDALDDARALLAVRFRFLDQALWKMPLVPSFDMYGIASDGRCVLFDPVYVVDRFKISPNEVVRDVVHCLFHCIFRHPFMLYSVLRQPWDVACDIAVESMLLDLLGEDFPCNMDRRAKDSLRVLRAQAGGVLTAERLYRFFSDTGNHVDLTSLAPLFRRDLHGLWYGREDEDGRRGSQAASARESEEGQAYDLPSAHGKPQDVVEAGDNLEDLLSQAGFADSEEPTSSDGSGSGEAAGDALDARSEEDVAREWEDISKHIQVDLETHLAKRGEGAGNLVAQLKAVNRERHDYAQFLRRFATLSERMKVNEDEFDYIYYTFGLKRYGNMPLIEPLEYREDRQVRDFALVIDTSESCSGDLVQAFMRKTYNILKQSESFSSRVNVHVIQCDAKVQDDVKIESLEQLELYMKDMSLKGFGGTDFRPAFDYVNLLVEKGEFADLRGLVYFTDGQGTYPRKPPAYDAVFAFLDDGYSDPAVPPWALKVVFDEGDLR